MKRELEFEWKESGKVVAEDIKVFVAEEYTVKLVDVELCIIHVIIM
jgi:hypothetical protein